MKIMRPHRSGALAIVMAVLLVLLTSCGGGNGTAEGGTPPPGNPSFTMSIDPSSVTVAPGSSTTLQLVVSTTDGFDGAIHVAVSGVPSGVSLSPSSPFSIPSTGGYITVTVGSAVALGAFSLEFQGNGGTATKSASASLNVMNATQTTPPGGSSFIPTGQEPFAAVFDPTHKLVFASLPWLDMVEVVSTTTHQLIKSIPVQGPEGLDLSLDDSQLLVGSTTNQYFTIDTTQLSVVGQTTIPPVNTGLPQYIQPQWAFLTANGNILIVGTGDFPVAVFEWNPKTQKLTPRPEAGVGNTARGAKSANGAKVLLYDPTNGGASIYDAPSDSFTQIQSSALGAYFPDGGAVNPTGTQMAFSIYDGPVVVMDGNGNIVQQLVGPTSFGLAYSVDGKDLFSTSLTATAFQIQTVDATSFQTLGTAPVYASNTLGLTRVLPWNPDLEPAVLLAVDDKGFVYGGADHGLAIDNSNNFQGFGSGAYVPVFVRWEPSEGPLNVGTSVTLNVGISGGLGTMFASPNVFVGSQLATNVVASNPGQLVFTTPASSTAGAQTAEIQQSDGTTSYLPLAFTYGSLLVPQAVMGLPPSGGVTADIFGYGLSVDIPSSTTNVLVGGQNAPVTSKTIGLSGIDTYPFPVQHLQVTTPAGTPGPANVLVNSPTGAVTGAGVVHYLKSVEVSHSSDTLFALAYDSTRKRVYLSAGNHVDVFDVVSNTFVSPIALPSSHGSSMATGLTVTPDGSRLLVSNAGDSSISVIDPDNPSSGVAVNIPFAPPPPGAQCMQNPGQIVAINTGFAYANTFSSGVDSCGSIGAVELNIAALTARVINSISDPANPMGYLSTTLMAVSRGGGTMAVTDFNNIYVLDVGTGVWQMRQLDSNSNLYDIAVSSDGSLTAISTLSYGLDIGFPFGDNYRDRYIAVDPGLNVTSSLEAPQLLQYFAGNRVQGMQLHDTGSLIYAMQNQEVDIYDLHNGQERERVLLPEQRTSEPAAEILAQTAIDTTGSQIFLLTQSGLTTVTLDFVPLSISTATPSVGSSSGGVQITLHGSGFDSTTTAILGGSPAAVTFVDTNTLQLVTPSTAKGALQAIVQNADGQTYTIDNVYTAN
jgi:IPT/TIG domain